MSTIWVIAPFDYEEPEKWQEVWESNLREGFISIGWADLGNVSKLSETEIYNAHRKACPKAKPKGASSDAKVLVKFWNDIEIGQTVVARRGRKCIAAMGTVVSKPYYSTSKTKKVFRPFSAYPNHLDVVWDAEPRDVLFDRQVFGMQTIHTIGRIASNIHRTASTAVCSSLGTSSDRHVAGLRNFCRKLIRWTCLPASSYSWRS